MPFADGPQLEYIGKGLYVTRGATNYVGGRDIEGCPEVVHIPAGFRTDLASVPRIFWWFLPPTGVYERAAVVHDFGCDELNRFHREMGRWKAGERDDPPLPPLLASRDVDGLFRRICREAGTGRVRYWELWWGVRLGALFNRARRGGWLHWKDTPAVLLITLLNLAAVFGAWTLSAKMYQLLF